LNVLKNEIDDESGHRMVGMEHDCGDRVVGIGHDCDHRVIGIGYDCDDRVVDIEHDHGILDDLEKKIGGEDADVEMNYGVVVVLLSIV
jgi:hypothetical protein